MDCGVEIKNRIVMPPMTTRTADDDGCVTEDTIAYFVARARGGVGLIMAEMASPKRAGRHCRRELGIYDDRFLPGLTRLADARRRQSLDPARPHAARHLWKVRGALSVFCLLASSKRDVIGGQGPSLPQSGHTRLDFGIRTAAKS